METDVLIAGAGPTGLMLANQLARSGVRSMIIDRHAGPAQQTRAMAVQARTLEVYAKLGIAERAHELGQRGDGANMWAEGRLTARIPIGEIGKGSSPFPYVLMLGQDDNERILGDKLAEHGVRVRWKTELIGLKQHRSGVEADLLLADGTTQVVQARYVAGCDGAHSAVRRMNGIGFPGAPYEQVFFVADTEAIGPMVPGELNVYLWRGGFHLFFPMRGANRWRVIGILPRRLRDRHDLVFHDVIPALRDEAGIDLSFNDCSWFSTYRIHHRAAERFRAGRCFLLGDAAHIHSPAGGQGMNTGLQDAYNLAWKLGLVIAGTAGEALLDSYEAERMPVAQRLLRTTDRAFESLVSDDWIASLLRRKVIARVAAVAMKRERIRRLAFRTISQTGIRYRKSVLSRTLPEVGESAPRGGDRFPWLRVAMQPGGPVEDLFQKLDDTRLNLLAFGQPAPLDATFGLGDKLRVHAIPAQGENASELKRAGIAAPSFYLLRPDGHVGLAGGRFEPEVVERYVAESMGRLAKGKAEGDGMMEGHKAVAGHC